MGPFSTPITRPKWARFACRSPARLLLEEAQFGVVRIQAYYPAASGHWISKASEDVFIAALSRILGRDDFEEHLNSAEQRIHTARPIGMENDIAIALLTNIAQIRAAHAISGGSVRDSERVFAETLALHSSHRWNDQTIRQGCATHVADIARLTAQLIAKADPSATRDEKTIKMYRCAAATLEYSFEQPTAEAARYMYITCIGELGDFLLKIGECDVAYECFDDQIAKIDRALAVRRRSEFVGGERAYKSWIASTRRAALVQRRVAREGQHVRQLKEFLSEFGPDTESAASADNAEVWSHLADRVAAQAECRMVFYFQAADCCLRALQCYDKLDLHDATEEELVSRAVKYLSTAATLGYFDDDDLATPLFQRLEGRKGFDDALRRITRNAVELTGDPPVAIEE